MSNYCNTCQHYRVTHDGPHCFKGKVKPVSPISTGDCWEPVTAPPQIATKVCSRCGRELPVEAFGRHAKTRDGYQPVCRECRSAEARKTDENSLPLGRRPAHPTYTNQLTGEIMKWCRLCNQYKPITDFHANRTAKDGHCNECKACHNARTVEAQRKRIAAKKEAKKAEPEVTEPVINDLATPIPPIPTLYSATDDQLVQELRNRGYTGNIIKKTSYIL